MDTVEFGCKILTALVVAWLAAGVALLIMYPPTPRGEIDYAVLFGKTSFAAAFLAIISLAMSDWRGRLEYFGLSTWRFALALALGMFGLVLFILEEALLLPNPVVAVSDTGSINVGMAAAVWELTVPAVSRAPPKRRVRSSLAGLAAVSMAVAGTSVVSGFAVAWASGWDPTPAPVSPWLAAEVGSHLLALVVGVHAWTLLLDRGPEVAVDNPAIRFMVPGVSLLGFSLVGACIGDMYPLPPVPYVLVVIAPAWVGGISYALALLAMIRSHARERLLGAGPSGSCLLNVDLSGDPVRVVGRLLRLADEVGLATVALAPPGSVADRLEGEVNLLIETGVGLVGTRRPSSGRVEVELDAGVVAGIMSKFRKSAGTGIFLIVWSLNDLVTELDEVGTYRFVRRILEELRPDEVGVFLADRSGLTRRFSKAIASILGECPSYMRPG